MAVVTGTLVVPANREKPPGRVRHMFKKLDANGDGFLCLDELMLGFEREFEKVGGGLAPHAKDAIGALFEEHAKEDDAKGACSSRLPFHRLACPGKRTICSQCHRWAQSNTLCSPRLRAGKVLKIGQFARFYAVILFKHFDADDSGRLELEEATAALKFLTKPSPDSPDIQVAFPPQACDEAGRVKSLPFSWFWSTFRAMD